MEQEIDDLTAESRKMRLIHQSQQGTIAVLKTRNQSLENELALARRRIVSLEKQLAAGCVKTSQGPEEKFSYVSRQGMEDLFGAAGEPDVRPA